MLIAERHYPRAACFSIRQNVVVPQITLFLFSFSVCDSELTHRLHTEKANVTNLKPNLTYMLSKLMLLVLLIQRCSPKKK